MFHPCLGGCAGDLGAGMSSEGCRVRTWGGCLIVKKSCWEERGRLFPVDVHNCTVDVKSFEVMLARALDLVLFLFIF